MERSNYWVRKANSSRLSRRRFMGGAAVAGAGAGAFALVGCGDDDDDDDDDGPDPTATSSSGDPSASATGEPSASATAPPSGMTPQDGSHIIVTGAGEDFTTVDPHREIYPSPGAILPLAYSNLIIYEDAARGNLRGDVAKGPPEQVDELTFVFEIHENVASHDKPPTSGRVMTTEDIAWNINRQIAGVDFSGNATPMYRVPTIYFAVEGAEAVDATHVQVKLNQPFAPWLTAMGDLTNNLIFPEVAEIIDGDLLNPNADYIVGTGPYVYTQYTPGERLEAERFPEYFRKALGEQIQHADKIVQVNLGADINAQQAAFVQKQTDQFQSTNQEILNAVGDATGIEEQYEIPNPNTHRIVIYSAINPPFDNPLLRQAVNLIVDRQKVLQIAYGGIGRINGQVPWPYTDWALTPEELAETPGFRSGADRDQDIADARAMWEAGGGPEYGTIDLSLVEGASAQEDAIWWTNMLKDGLGVDQFTTTAFPIPSLLPYLTSDAFENILIGIPTWNTIDPRNRVRDGFGDANGAVNFGHYENPEITALIDRSMGEFDLETAQETIREVQRMLHADGGGGSWPMAGTVDRGYRWPYYHRNQAFINYLGIELQSAWIDQDDPSFDGRPGL